MTHSEDLTHYYSAERRLLRLVHGRGRGEHPDPDEITLIETDPDGGDPGPSLELVDMTPEIPAWMPRLTLRVFRNDDAKAEFLFWLAVGIGLALLTTGAFVLGHAILRWQAGGRL